MVLGLDGSPPSDLVRSSRGDPREASYDACFVFSSLDYYPVFCLRMGLQHLVKIGPEGRGLEIFHLRHRTNPPADARQLMFTFRQGMERSRTLILMASPESARSTYAERELRLWLERKSPDDMVIARTRGEVVWDSAAGGFEVVGSSAIPSAVNPVLQRTFARPPPVLDMSWLPRSRKVRVPCGPYLGSLRNLAVAILGCDRADIVVVPPPKRGCWSFVSAS